MFKWFKRQPEILFTANIPYQIEAHWDTDWAPRLAGFPVNIRYSGTRKGKAASCCYFFDPHTYVEDSEKREMAYYPRVRSEYWIIVQHYKVPFPNGNCWYTAKFKGDEVICFACGGADFDRVMMHTTLIGLHKDEPVD